MVKEREISIFGYRCPIVTSCCFCIPLHLATYLIAILGILPSITCTTFSTPIGSTFLENHGFPLFYSPTIECIYGCLALTVFSSHVILGVGAAMKLPKLYFVYLWTSVVYMIGSFCIAVIISAETIKAGHINFGIAYIFLATIYTILLIYFWIVIQSQLYKEKGESNVINIHITIL